MTEVRPLFSKPPAPPLQQIVFLHTDIFRSGIRVGPSRQQTPVTAIAARASPPTPPQNSSLTPALPHTPASQPTASQQAVGCMLARTTLYRERSVPAFAWNPSPQPAPRRGETEHAPPIRQTTILHPTARRHPSTKHRPQSRPTSKTRSTTKTQFQKPQLFQHFTNLSRVQAPHSPRHTGSRFSVKARAPSC